MSVDDDLRQLLEPDDDPQTLSKWNRVEAMLRELDAGETLRPEMQRKVRVAVAQAADHHQGPRKWRWGLGFGLATALAGVTAALLVVPKMPGLDERAVARAPTSVPSGQDEKDDVASLELRDEVQGGGAAEPSAAPKQAEAARSPARKGAPAPRSPDRKGAPAPRSPDRKGAPAPPSPARKGSQAPPSPARKGSQARPSDRSQARPAPSRQKKGEALAQGPAGSRSTRESAPESGFGSLGTASGRGAIARADGDSESEARPDRLERSEGPTPVQESVPAEDRGANGPSNQGRSREEAPSVPASESEVEAEAAPEPEPQAKPKHERKRTSAPRSSRRAAGQDLQSSQRAPAAGADAYADVDRAQAKKAKEPEDVLPAIRAQIQRQLDQAQRQVLQKKYEPARKTLRALGSQSLNVVEAAAHRLAWAEWAEAQGLRAEAERWARKVLELGVEPQATRARKMLRHLTPTR